VMDYANDYAVQKIKTAFLPTDLRKLPTPRYECGRCPFRTDRITLAFIHAEEHKPVGGWREQAQ
jgi:hypothetical protein